MLSRQNEININWRGAEICVTRLLVVDIPGDVISVIIVAADTARAPATGAGVQARHSDLINVRARRVIV